MSLSTQALACQGTTTVFDDKFREIDPAWQNLKTYFGKVDNGHLLIDAPDQGTKAISYGIRILNQSNVYTDAYVCANFSFNEAKEPAETHFGIAFWAVDES